MEAPLLKDRAAVEPPLLEDQVIRTGTPTELWVEALLEAPPRQDLTDLGAKDNATAAGTHDQERPRRS